MADLDLVPPSLPGARTEKHDGFFKRFFFKENTQDRENTPSPSMRTSRDEQDIDLEEIKRKLQLDDMSPVHEQPAMQTHDPLDDIAPARSEEITFTPQVQEADLPAADASVEIGDWTEEATPAPQIPAQESALAHEEIDLQEPSAQDSEWDRDFAPNEEEQAPATSEHHEEAEAQFAKIDEKHEKIAAAIEEVPELPVADWHLQEREVPQDKYFILRNGHPIKSLRELTEALEFIDDATFAHHMNEHRNDFANWVEGVIANPQLAQEIRQSQSREEVAAVLAAHRSDAQQRLSESVRTHEKTLKKTEKIADDLEKLRDQLAKKTAELNEEKLAAKKRIKDALDRELESRMAKEREEIAHEHQRIEEERAEVSRLHDEAERMLKEHEQQAAKLDAREQKITQREEQIAQQRSQLQQEKQEASVMLKDAAKIKSDLEKIASYQKQIQEQLKDIEKREAAMERAEVSLKQREAKVSADLTRMHEQETRLAQLQQEHDARERQVKDVEAAAAAKAADAQRRAKEASAVEKASTMQIKEHTAKLDAMRKKIDTSLKKVIKNKNQAMHAKQLREHLEKTILETRQGVVQERKELENEGMAAMMERRAESTPIGQPGSAVDEDVLVVKDLDVYKKVEMARAALDKGDLNSAKQFYNELRDEFGKQKLSAPEKNALYMSIRELYDDIHLAMLEQ